MIKNPLNTYILELQNINPPFGLVVSVKLISNTPQLQQQLGWLSPYFCFCSELCMLANIFPISIIYHLQTSEIPEVVQVASLGMIFLQLNCHRQYLVFLYTIFKF